MREYRKDLQFNLITEKEAKHDLKHKGAKAMLYFVTEDREASSGLPLIAESSSLTSESSSPLARSFNTPSASLRPPLKVLRSNTFLKNIMMSFRKNYPMDYLQYGALNMRSIQGMS